MAALHHIDRAAVLAALAECDAAGAAAFLARHGYRDSTRYRVLHRGRSYPSKAVVGVAGGLAPADFFGGVAQTVPLLQRLGFTVARQGARGLRPVPAARLARLARTLGAVAGRPYLPDGHARRLAAVFASGANKPGEIRGFAACGIDVGVAAPSVTPAAELALAALAGSDINVFIDSGAFGEARPGARLLGHKHWRRVLSLYRRLAATLGPQLWCVAPDRVGDQDMTLRRLIRYRADMLALHQLGARVLVPIQRGALAAADFAHAVREALAVPFVPALPCNRAVMTPLDVAAFLDAARPGHVHLLGIGPRNARLDDYLVAFEGTDTSVSIDANWITANVGRSGAVRLYTAAQDVARRVVGASLVPELALLIALGAHA